MANEKLIWKKMSQNTPEHSMVCRVENTAYPGMFDVFYQLESGISGFIELKHAPRKRLAPGDVVKLPHWTPEQKNFGEDYARAGGVCWLLLWLKDEYMLFEPEHFRKVGEADYDFLQRHAWLKLPADRTHWGHFWAVVSAYHEDNG